MYCLCSFLYLYFYLFFFLIFYRVVRYGRGCGHREYVEKLLRYNLRWTGGGLGGVEDSMLCRSWFDLKYLLF